MSQLKKGVVLSYVNIVLRNALGLFMTPFIVKQLGDSEYGLYMLIGSLVAYFSLMDLGINSTTIRFIAKYRAKNDQLSEKKFLSTISFIYLGISAIIVLLGVIAFFNFDAIFGKSLTLNEIEEAKKMFVFLIFGIMITIPGGIFLAIAMGYERFVFAQSLAVWKYLSRTGLLVLLLWKDGDALTIVIIDTVINVLFIAIAAYYVIIKLKVSVTYKNYSKIVLFEVFSYSVWIFIFAMFNKFQWQSGQVVLGILKNTETVAVFAIGIVLGTYYGTFASAISSLLLPKATKMLYDGTSMTEVNNTLIKVGSVTLLLLFFILGGFILVGYDFVLLWVGKSYSDSWLIALLIMVVITIPLTQSFANSVLEATKRLKVKVLSALFSMIFGVTLGVFLVEHYDMFGMIAGLLTGRIIYELILNYYYIKVVKFDILLFFKKVYLKKTIAFIFVTITVYFSTKNFIVVSWKDLLIKITLYSIVYFFVFYIFALTKYEKNIIKTILNIKN